MVRTSLLPLALSLVLPLAAAAAPRPSPSVKPKPAPKVAPKVTKAAPAKKSAKPAKAQARVLLPKERARAHSLAPRPPRYPAVDLYEPNLAEELVYRPFDERGRPRVSAGRELERFLRDHHTGKRHRIDPRLAKALYTVARHFGHRVEVFSGYRPPEFSTRKHSRHLTGSAVDFRVPGVRNEEIVRWLRQTFHPAGVGYYPNGVHVHLDLDRDHDTYWVDTGDAPSPVPTDKDADEATVDEHVALPPPPPIFDADVDGAKGEIIVPEGPDDDPGFLD